VCYHVSSWCQSKPEPKPAFKVGPGEEEEEINRALYLGHADI